MFQAHIEQTPRLIIIVDKDPAGKEGGYWCDPVVVDQMGQTKDKGVAQHQKILLGDYPVIPVKIVDSVNDLLRKNRSYGI